MKPCTCERLMHHAGCEYDGPEITAAALAASEAARAALVAGIEQALGAFDCWAPGAEYGPGGTGIKKLRAVLDEQPSATATEALAQRGDREGDGS